MIRKSGIRFSVRSRDQLKNLERATRRRCFHLKRSRSSGEPRGIRCNVVAPGLIDTPLGRAATQRRTDRARHVPFGRQGTGWEVAYATIFLISNEASYINAHVLLVDGGLGYGIAR